MSSADVEWYRSLEASFVAPSNASFSTWPDTRHESSAHRQTSRLLRLAQAGKNVTITLTGGSSSAARESFAYHFGRQLADALSPRERGGNCMIDASSSTWRCPVAGRFPGQLVEIVPAANGHTGTDFAALLMDALVPQRTDILVWEYVINDWSTQLLNPRFTDNALDLYLRRALAINPRMVFVFVHLWVPLAAGCWPQCVMGGGPKFMYEAVTSTLERNYQDRGLDWTSIDFNDIATQHYVAHRGKLKLVNETHAMFSDKQHPNQRTHRIIGSVVWQHFRPFVLNTKREVTANAGTVMDHAPVENVPLPMPPTGLPGVSNMSNASVAARMMWRFLSKPGQVHSWTHSLPHNGDSAEYVSYGLAGSRYAQPGDRGVQSSAGSTLIKVAIEAAASRSDSMRYARLPLCNGATGFLRHSLQFQVASKRHGHQVASDPQTPRFVGINFVASQGRSLAPKAAAEDMDRGLLNLTLEYVCQASPTAGGNEAGSTTAGDYQRNQGRTCFAPMASSMLVPGSIELADLAEERNVTTVAVDLSSIGASAPHRKLRPTSPDDRRTGFAVLLRGIHAPQNYFELPDPRVACGPECTDPIEVSIRVCQRTLEGAAQGLGAVLFI